MDAWRVWMATRSALHSRAAGEAETLLGVCASFNPTFPRLVTEDVEMAGIQIPAGARVDVCLGAANRDPARWQRPDEHDIYRPAPQLVGGLAQRGFTAVPVLFQ
jgi:hypothetical protein